MGSAHASKTAGERALPQGAGRAAPPIPVPQGGDRGSSRSGQEIASSGRLRRIDGGVLRQLGVLYRHPYAAREILGQGKIASLESLRHRGTKRRRRQLL